MLGKIKWLVGTIFFFTFVGALLTYGVFALTSENTSKQMIGKILNISFTQLGSNSKEVTRVINYANTLYENQDAMQAMTKLNPDTIQKDLANLSEEEKQKYLEEKVVAPMYENGTKIIEPLKAMDPDQTVTTERLEFLSMANVKSHDVMRKILIGDVILLVILSGILVALNSGLKRLTFPAMLVFFASLPGFLLFTFFNPLVEKFIHPLIGGYVNSSIYSSVLTEVFNPTISIFRNIHLTALLTGLALIILSFILSKIVESDKPKEQKPEPVKATAQ